MMKNILYFFLRGELQVPGFTGHKFDWQLVYIK